MGKPYKSLNPEDMLGLPYVEFNIVSLQLATLLEHFREPAYNIGACRITYNYFGGCLIKTIVYVAPKPYSSYKVEAPILPPKLCSSWE